MAHYKDVTVKKSSSLNLVTGFFQYLRDEQEAVQKRTFTKWINSHLTKRKPPLEVTDLFEDIKDGVKLLALLEVLSGQRLPCEQGRQLKRIHWVSNIGTALRFLEGRKSVYRGSPIKLVNIHATDIADGRPSIVLGLIWTVILYFQIEELTSNLLALEALSSSTSSVDSMASSSETGSPALKREVAPKKFQGNAKKALLRWVQSTAAKYVHYATNYYPSMDIMPLTITPVSASSLHFNFCTLYPKPTGKSIHAMVLCSVVSAYSVLFYLCFCSLSLPLMPFCAVCISSCGLLSWIVCSSTYRANAPGMFDRDSCDFLFESYLLMNDDALYNLNMTCYREKNGRF
ncbi:unnamed protein product [Oncorhynchus mykiss]|uniref:Calponin-homology (CH) domain-containing protein n=1 Tax=Oncorhynchus mykiss TaxID=8022 RepID=A0A060WJY9_ONCMY|nr:unnamed protein product [Oncorhynchus mykiss]